MTSVRIVVHSNDTSVDIVEEDRVYSWGGGIDDRHRISTLMLAAVEKVVRAYGLEDPKAAD